MAAGARQRQETTGRGPGRRTVRQETTGRGPGRRTVRQETTGRGPGRRTVRQQTPGRSMISDAQKQAACGAIGGAIPVFLTMLDKIGAQESILIGWEALGGYVAQMLGIGMALVGLVVVVASKDTALN